MPGEHEVEDDDVGPLLSRGLERIGAVAAVETRNPAFARW